jgi:hypothetical protein
MTGIEIQYYKVIIRKNIDNKYKQSQNNSKDKDKDRTTKVIELQTIKNLSEKK